MWELLVSFLRSWFCCTPFTFVDFASSNCGFSTYELCRLYLDRSDFIDFVNMSVAEKKHTSTPQHLKSDLIRSQLTSRGTDVIDMPSCRKSSVRLWFPWFDFLVVGDIIYIYNHPIGNIYIYTIWQSFGGIKDLQFAFGTWLHPFLHVAPQRGGRRWFQDGESGGNCPVPRGFGSPKRSRGWWQQPLIHPICWVKKRAWAISRHTQIWMQLLAVFFPGRAAGPSRDHAALAMFFFSRFSRKSFDVGDLQVFKVIPTSPKMKRQKGSKRYGYCFRRLRRSHNLVWVIWVRQLEYIPAPHACWHTKWTID